MNIIERAAQAVVDQFDDSFVELLDPEGPLSSYGLSHAIVRAVLTAIREPSESMKKAGAFCHPFMTAPGDKPMTPGQIIACACYDAMIEAALSESD